jgi:lipopolysaccharide export system permease protein
MRLRVLTRYLIKIHIGPFLFALATITGLIFLNAIAQRIEGLIGKGLPWTVVVEFLVLSLPHTIALSLPMSVLVAVLYSFTELESSNEITAMSAAGIRPTRVLVPLLGMGAVVTVVMLYFNDQVLPESNHRLKNLLVDIGRKSPTLELREQIVNEIRTESGLDVYFMTADRIDRVANKLEEVTIFDSNSPTRRRTTYAASGEMAFNDEKTDLYLTLFDGVMHEVQTDRIGGFQRVYFDKQIIPLRNVGNELERRFGGTDRSDREMGFALLSENVSSREAELDSVRIDSREKALQALRLALGRPVDEDTALVGTMLLYQSRNRNGAFSDGTSLLARDPITQSVVISSRTRASRGATLRASANRYKVEIHKKLAIAFACLVFTILGPPLALRFRTGGVGMVAATSSAIFAIYWLGLIGGETLADRRFADPAITMWLANLVFLSVGIVLVSRMGHKGSAVRGKAILRLARIGRSRHQDPEGASA